MTRSHDISLDSEMPKLAMDLSGFFGSTSISFVVADAKRDDMPILYVNRAFELTTGYSHRFVIGRNCRFLQGPDTDPEAVKNIAIALSRGEAIRQKILNYRADGTRFINDLVLTPIHDDEGDTAYFVGVQRELDADHPDLKEELKQQSLELIRQQVQIHLSIVMQMSRIHMDAQNQSDIVEIDYFTNLLRRLETLDLLYETLSEGADGQPVMDAGAFISQIAAKLVSRSPKPGLRINISTERAIVPIDIAIRLGAALSEILEASIGSIAPHSDSSLIEVTFHATSQKLVLSYFDEGDRDEQWIGSHSFEKRMLDALLLPVKGEIILSNDDETTAKITVPFIATPDG